MTIGYFVSSLPGVSWHFYNFFIIEMFHKFCLQSD